MADLRWTNPVRPFDLRPTPGLWIGDDGRRLVGGSPLRILTLTEQGAELTAKWFDGEAVGLEPSHQALAGRLVEADLATAGSATATSPPGRLPRPEVAIVIPVKDDADGLNATLTALTARSRFQPGCGVTGNTVISRIVVVDDGSEPAVDPAIGDRIDIPVSLSRRASANGPGNARNLGIAGRSEPVIVFVDAGVIVFADQISELVDELAVGQTVAVAPRIRSENLPGRLSRYERSWSPLDLGAEAALVGPGRRLSYVPSTCLAVRASAIHAVSGFEPELRFGEDVDLVWRLRSQGWVRYVPHIEVTHPPRTSIGDFLRQRYRYGTSAAPLGLRHGSAVAPARLDIGTAATATALLTGRYRAAGLVAGFATAAFVRVLVGHRVPYRVAGRIVAAGWIGTVRGLGVSTSRTWWHIAAPAASIARLRPLSMLLVVGWLRRLRGRREHGPPTDTAARAGRRLSVTCGELALGILDDSAYAVGVWRGAARWRTVKPLLPQVTGRWRRYWAMNKSSS